jgi:hypothetical protein
MSITSETGSHFLQAAQHTSLTLLEDFLFM